RLGPILSNGRNLVVTALPLGGEGDGDELGGDRHHVLVILVQDVHDHGLGVVIMDPLVVVLVVFAETKQVTAIGAVLVRVIVIMVMSVSMFVTMAAVLGTLVATGAADHQADRHHDR